MVQFTNSRIVARNTVHSYTTVQTAATALVQNRFRDIEAAEQIIGRERRERVSHRDWSGDG